MTKPKVTLNCPASRYERANEKIIEFSFPGTPKTGQGPLGGLISFDQDDNGNVRVFVYRCDPEITVQVSKDKR